MLVLRILAVLVVIGVAGCVGAYFLTADRRYLTIAYRLLRWALVVALGFFGLLLLERVAVVAPLPF